MKFLALALLFFVAFAQARPQSEDNVRIVGGQDAPVGFFKQQVSLRTPSDKHYCMGTILNNRWVLTSGQCLLMGGYPAKLRLGSVDIDNGILYAVAVRKLHPSYDSATNANDLGMVKTTTVIAFGANVNALPVPTASPGVGATVYVNGWGSTDKWSFEPSKIMQYYTTLIYDQAACADKWNWLVDLDPATTICTYYSGRQTCYYDLGAAMGYGAIHGVLTRSFPCFGNYPDVYTRVSYYRPWITATMAT